ncbi:MAG: Trp biosynthesis-associated membrane protein [Actinomycetota bacterium]
MKLNLNFLWLISLGLVCIAGGFTWVGYQFTQEAGGKAIVLSGYEVFPSMAPILLLQAAALVVSLLLSAGPKRILAIILALCMGWHLAELIFIQVKLFEVALNSSIAAVSGVAGQSAQQALLASSNFSSTWIAYLVLGLVNVGVLGLVALGKNRVLKKEKTQESVSVGLWEQQRR